MMAERLSDIVAQIRNVEQLKAIVTAMRGIAASGPCAARRLDMITEFPVVPRNSLPLDNSRPLVRTFFSAYYYCTSLGRFVPSVHMPAPARGVHL